MPRRTLRFGHVMSTAAAVAAVAVLQACEIASVTPRIIKADATHDESATPRSQSATPQMHRWWNTSGSQTAAGSWNADRANVGVCTCHSGNCSKCAGAPSGLPACCYCSAYTCGPCSGAPPVLKCAFPPACCMGLAPPAPPPTKFRCDALRHQCAVSKDGEFGHLADCHAACADSCKLPIPSTYNPPLQAKRPPQQTSVQAWVRQKNVANAKNIKRSN